MFRRVSPLESAYKSTEYRTEAAIAVAFIEMGYADRARLDQLLKKLA